jgi:hypothetical protein
MVAFPHDFIQPETLLFAFLYYILIGELKRKKAYPISG